ncbi:hypothetical protein ASZ90_017055 [hydrocarbon metagenome]|uniref:Uncharacterized protein n=1 Tax=hydrocarbon metagenome TaxID=938273 RepID=A0A0W8EA55_9ZZZZ
MTVNWVFPCGNDMFCHTGEDRIPGMGAAQHRRIAANGDGDPGGGG